MRPLKFGVKAHEEAQGSTAPLPPKLRAMAEHMRVHVSCSLLRLCGDWDAKLGFESTARRNFL